MQFVIAGAGSIGLLIGSYLAEHGASVHFLVRRQEQAAALKEGIIRLDGDKQYKADVFAETDVHALPADALWIIAVKYDALDEVLRDIQTLAVRPALLFIQNGIGHLETVKTFGMTDRVFFAAVEHGAARIDDRTVRHNGVGPLTIAAAEDQPFADYLQQVDPQKFPVKTADDAERLLLRKVFINCAINPLTAVLQVANGELVRNPHFRRLFDEVCSELFSSFPEMEEVLTAEDIAAVCEKTAANRSSMLSDRLKGRKMEIDTIVTAMLKKIEQRSGQAPFLTNLEAMLRGLDRSE